MTDFIIFEDGKEPRLFTTKFNNARPRIQKEDGLEHELNVREFVDARNDEIYGYFVGYESDLPPQNVILNAIDALKPRGEKYNKP